MNDIPYFFDNFDAANAQRCNAVGRRLLAARKKLGLKQSDISSRLHKYSLNISAKQVSKWENGDSIPNAYQFLALCCVLKLDPATFTGRIPSSDELDDDDLNAEGKQLITEYRNFLVSSGRYKPKGPIKRITMPVLDLYQLPNIKDL